MLVANSFDLWQKDTFFSAAEEVQESADILDSAYRKWVSVKRDGLSSADLEDPHRELQTALGTAKWQLDEFEKAVRSSYGSCRDQSNNMTRHQQFIVAIDSQISRAEDALHESLNKEGKQEPFRWVNLNEDERDDLAMFLSGFSTSAKNRDLDFAPCSTSSSSKDEIVITIGKSDSVTELSSKRTVCVSKFGSMNVLIPDEDDTRKLMGEIEDTPKERGSKLSNFLRFRVVNYINQSFRRYDGGKLRLQSTRLLIMLIVSIILLVHYLVQ